MLLSERGSLQGAPAVWGLLHVPNDAAPDHGIQRLHLPWKRGGLPGERRSGEKEETRSPRDRSGGSRGASEGDASPAAAGQALQIIQGRKGQSRAHAPHARRTCMVPRMLHARSARGEPTATARTTTSLRASTYDARPQGLRTRVGARAASQRTRAHMPTTTWEGRRRPPPQARRPWSTETAMRCRRTPPRSGARAHVRTEGTRTWGSEE